MSVNKKKIFVDYEIARQFMAILDGDAKALTEMQQQQKTAGTPIHRFTEHFNLRHAVLDAQDAGEVTADLLRKLFHYDPDTGIFTRRTASHTWKTGTVAGTKLKDGHIRMLVGRKNYLAHRLAILYMTGSMPSKVVDHINGNPADNRFINLRDVDVMTNTHNRGFDYVKNKHGLPGVSFNKLLAKFEAHMRYKGDRIFLGRFDAAEDAHAAYARSKNKVRAGEPPDGLTKVAIAGCSFDETTGKYRAAITHKGKQIFLGRFDAEEDAKRAYFSAKEKLLKDGKKQSSK